MWVWLQRKCDERKREVEKKRERLQETRRESVVALQNFVFPITVEPLSQDDAGEEGGPPHLPGVRFRFLLLRLPAVCRDRL